MGLEIERKFLVIGNKWKIKEGQKCIQGYVSSNKEAVVRVRIYDNKGFLTLKGKNIGPTRTEFEHKIPLLEAKEMLESFCSDRIIEKIRYRIEFEGHIFEVDEFQGKNSGLIIAEIELSSEKESFKKPDWLGAEVTNDSRYYNSNLIDSPYKNFDS